MNSFKYIWITGASSGIGRALALELASRNCVVVVSARNSEALFALEAESKNIIAILFDITDKESLEKIRGQLREKVPYLDCIIINAGTCEYLNFPEPDWGIPKRLMEVNYIGSINTLEVGLPLLRREYSKSEEKNRKIIYIASQVVFSPFEKAGAYGATKAAADYFFDCLRIDLKHENILVTQVYPGFVDTPLTKKNTFKMPFLVDVNEAAKRVSVNAVLKYTPRYVFPKKLYVLLKFLAFFTRLKERLF